MGCGRLTLPIYSMSSVDEEADMDEGLTRTVMAYAYTSVEGLSLFSCPRRSSGAIQRVVPRAWELDVMNRLPVASSTIRLRPKSDKHGCSFSSTRMLTFSLLDMRLWKDGEWRKRTALRSPWMTFWAEEF